MKVSFTEDIKRQDTGKHKFLCRLSNEFEKQGVKIVRLGKKSDILLHIGRNLKERDKSKKIVYRVDGLWLNKFQNYNKLNKNIMKHIDKSDAIIYQSEFCKQSYEKFLSVNKQNTVIYNGVDPEDFIKRNPKNFFFAYANWRPHKRLQTICNAFEIACERGLDADLIIVGLGNKDNPKHNNRTTLVKHWVKSKQLKKYLSEAIAFIHVAWLDWCPNAMVEAVVSGCPLIYTTSGGSKEIGRDAGIPIKDEEWGFRKACDLYHPPNIINELIDAMIRMKKYPVIPFNRQYLHIDNVAKCYMDFFKNILK